MTEQNRSSDHTPPEALGSFGSLDICINPRQDAGYPVHITPIGQAEETTGILSPDLLPWHTSGDRGRDGRRLFDALFNAPHLRKAWDAARAETSHRRIRLTLEAPELNTLPWELLHDSTTLLSANTQTPLSRYVACPTSRAPSEIVHPVRVLFALSNPLDLEDYSLPSIHPQQERALFRAPDTEVPQAPPAWHAGLEIHYLEPPVTLERLEAEMSDYQIVHYVGHGVFNHRWQHAALYLQDAAGNAQLTRDEDLAAMLARLAEHAGNVPLITLAPPQEAPRATFEAFTSLGEQLTRAGAWAVAALPDLEITRSAFLQTFYSALVEHGTVDVAMNTARGELLTAGHVDTAMPVLFMCVPEGRLWPPPLPVPQVDWHALTHHINALRARVPKSCAPDAVETIEARLADLEAALRRVPPDLDAIKAIHDWFSAPEHWRAWRLAGAVLNEVILHPVARQCVARAGEAYVETYASLFEVGARYGKRDYVGGRGLSSPGSARD